MTEFTPFYSLLGGTLIGLSAVLLMLFHGSIAGISGMLGRFLPPRTDTDGLIWRAAFIIGLIVASIALKGIVGGDIAHDVSNDMVTMIIAGLLVGLGAGLSNGCISGHGVCGISRLSKRSIIATVTFMSFGILTVYIIRHVMGG